MRDWRQPAPPSYPQASLDRVGLPGAMAAAFAAGIVITINRDGKQTKIEVPDGSNDRITSDGQLEVALPGATKSAEETPRTPSTVINPAAELAALQGRWKVVRVEKGEDAAASLTRALGFDGSHERPANLGLGYLAFNNGGLRILTTRRLTAQVASMKSTPLAQPRPLI